MFEKPEKILIGLVILLVVLAIESAIIMLIWNKVIIKKFPTLLIQKLNFFEALAIVIFAHILFKSYSLMKYKDTKMK